MYHLITLIGDLGKDPEMRYISSGTAVTNFNVAVDDSYTDNQGQRTKRTMWIRVTAWGKQPETCNQYLKKGSRVLVEGHLTTQYESGEDQCNGPKVWVDKNGDGRANFEVTASKVRFLDKLGQGGQTQAQTQAAPQPATPPDPY